MGAKQSKRSVDISGKEAEGAGEVAAAGAGGEGRVEAIADADTLKPQLNGDAQHIQPPDEITEKEKQLDSGTPENEKDATTEKELKEESNETENAVVNGDSEQKPEQDKENTESAQTPEQEGKKPKKEKVKKKWSLRSISFSRKDKPKQEKKQKDKEPKNDGDREEVPEEAAETTVESIESKPIESTVSEAKEDKTPETPVTEPITNGSNTPESPKVESPAPEVPVIEEMVPNDRPESTPVTKPDQLPVNGLSLETKTEEVLEKAEPVQSIAEEKTAESKEVPAPEISLKTEDPLPVHDKIADLVPEVPDLPSECSAERSDVALVD